MNRKVKKHNLNSLVYIESFSSRYIDVGYMDTCHMGQT